MAAEVLLTHTPALFHDAVRRATERLRAGDVVALPTETVYGLAANALDGAAVRRVFEIKGRPAHNPVIVHVAGWEMARGCVHHWPESATRLGRAFWPGPLTIVLGRSSNIPDVVTARGPTVGVRWPSHPFIQAVIRECGFPLAAPSANLSNEISPTNVKHVERSLGRSVSLIVDGGQSQVGIESTVVDLTGPHPRMLRPGMIHRGSLSAALGEEFIEGGPASEILRSPGQLKRHYAPQAKLCILSWGSGDELLEQAREKGIAPAESAVITHTILPSPATWAAVNLIPHDAEAFARALYAEWHRCDEAGVRWIVMEAVPEGPEWRGIADRLQRAAAAG
ncbi:MAG TPA: threonylcarbamoyl-AMP synthase [Verrucomicrobiales bacterium]|nr:threonylcarbamoyl-AMP synthase [Verrucomicrobiales bacterium]